jgi:hypothetical protein
MIPLEVINTAEKMRSIGRPVSKIWSKWWMNVELKLSVGHCPVESDLVRLEFFWSSKLKARPYLGHVSVQWGWTLSGMRYLKNMIFSQNPLLSSQVWFLSCTAQNRMKLGHKSHLNTRNKFPKEVFPKSNDSLSDFRWTQKPRFWRNEDKFMKSKG